MYDYRESREHWEWANLAPFAGHSSDPSLNWRRSDNNAHLAHPLPPRPRPVEEHFPDLDAADLPTDDLAGSQSRFKTAFQIDKERIASSTAFRRLESKTQVFVAHEGDHFRTRLTHTIEVDETARAIAQALHLNEDLTNAIALGHDLGHTPFGHDGETALSQLFEKYWPELDQYDEHNGEKYGPVFFHNVQSVRVVDSLEKGYDWDRRLPGQKPNLFDPPIGQGWGLDLTWAVREGILKHS
jgi:dGTPase